MRHALAVRLPDISDMEMIADDQIYKADKQLEFVSMNHQTIIAEILTWCDETLGYLPNPEIKTTKNYVTYSLHVTLMLKFNSDEDRLHYLISRDDNITGLE